ncbi:MAG: HAMP domain-containing sensor histidine kinase, partial [Pseudomonadota bacterium]
TLWDEDMNNLSEVKHSLKKEWTHLLSDTQFLIAESERISRIVQSMRGLSIVKSEKKSHSLNTLLENTVDVMADYASKDAVVIDLKQPEHDVVVSVDRDEFLQSLTNLIRNSVQAIVSKKQSSESDSFEGRIEIESSFSDTEVRIKISDNGCGISKDHQGRLFDSQFTTKDRREGTGLGLNISRRFLRAVGGDIELMHSEEAIGASFVMILPLQKESERMPA